MFSVQGTLNYTSVESGDPKQKQSGLNNPALRLKGSSLMGAVHLHFGAEMSIGLEKRSVKSGGDSNVSTDGFGFASYVGFDTEVAGGGMLGASLAYSILGERNVEYATSGNYKLKGGNSLRISAFYEALVAYSIFGGGLNFNSIDEIKDQTGVYSKSYTTTALFFYSRLPMGSFDLIPRMEYIFSHSELDKAAIISLGAAVRFTF